MVKKSVLLFAGVATVLGGCAGSSGSIHVPPQTWDLQTDFSATVNPSNAWGYGQTSTLGSFVPYNDNTQVATHYAANPGIAGWDTTGNVYPLIGRNSSAATYFENWRPGDVYLSGFSSGSSSVARWTDPIAGRIQVSLNANFRRVESVTSNTSTFWVLLNGAVLKTGNLVTVGDEAVVTGSLPVQAGDVIDFVVGNDGTNWTGTGLVVTAKVQTGG